MEEEDLVALLKNPVERQRAFNLLVEQYKTPLYWHIRKLVRLHEDTDDVLQNTFIKVYHNIDNFKGTAKLYTWMYRIATNEAITFLNKKAKRLHLTTGELHEQLVNNLAADTYFDGTAAELKLQKAIASLPQKQQLVFNMKYFDEMKYQQISNIL